MYPFLSLVLITDLLGIRAMYNSLLVLFPISRILFCQKAVVVVPPVTTVYLLVERPFPIVS